MAPLPSFPLADYRDELKMLHRAILAGYLDCVLELFPRASFTARFLAALKTTATLSVVGVWRHRQARLLTGVACLLFGYLRMQSRAAIDPAAEVLNVLVPALEAGFLAFLAVPFALRGWRNLVPAFRAHFQPYAGSPLTGLQPCLFLCTTTGPTGELPAGLVVSRTGARTTTVFDDLGVLSSHRPGVYLFLQDKQGGMVYALNLLDGRTAAKGHDVLLRPGLISALSRRWCDLLRTRGVLRDIEALVSLLTDAQYSAGQSAAPEGYAVLCPRCKRETKLLAPQSGRYQCLGCRLGYAASLAGNVLQVEWSTPNESAPSADPQESGEQAAMAILGLSAGYTSEDLRQARRRAASLYHPDKYDALPEPLKKLADEKMKGINEAYALLSR